MRLLPGDEFNNAGFKPDSGTSPDRPHYRVTSVIRETPWWGLYEGKKVFTSFHFGRRALEATIDEESLDVLIKTLQYPDLNNRDRIKEQRERLSFECSRVLGRARRNRQPLSNLFPEPIDYLEVPNERDQFGFAKPQALAQSEPILIMERARGLALDAWLREKTPSPLQILRVLASLLELISAAHGDGLLLAGFSPQDIWVNEEGRVHFLGSDLVLDAGKQQKQRKLYPPERYAPGFAPPEFFEDKASLEQRTDLYSWSMLAYFLLSRDDPALIAKAQGDRFAWLENEHFAALDKPLRQVSTSDLRRIQRFFRVRGSRFANCWPDAFIAALRDCLRPVAEERPKSAEAIVEMWSSLAPGGVPAALAVQNGKEVEILVMARDVDPSLVMVIRRGNGTLVAEGSPSSRVTDKKPVSGGGEAKPGTLAYSVLLRTNDSEPVFSPPTEAPLLDLSNPGQLVAFAEAQASKGEELPASLALLEGYSDATPAAQAWFGSSQIVVRRWAVRLLQGHMRDRRTHSQTLEMLINNGLLDSDASVRDSALVAIFQGERKPDPNLVLRVAVALGGGTVEGSMKAATAIPNLDPLVISQAVSRLAQEKPEVCPVCQQSMLKAALAVHLVEKHGYVEVDRKLQSYADALRELWQALFGERKPAAVSELVKLMQTRHGDKTATSFRNAFEAQYRDHASKLGEMGPPTKPGPNWVALAGCLASQDLTRGICTELLANPDAGLRLLARLALLPETGKRLAQANAKTVRETLQTMCPLDGDDVRAAYCHQLLAHGANAKAAKEVVDDFEQQLPSACTRCGEMIFRRDEVEHMRRKHDLHKVGETWLEWHAALPKLLENPDAETAQLWYEIAAEHFKPHEIVAQLVRQIATNSDSARLFTRLPISEQLLVQLADSNQDKQALQILLGIPEPSLNALRRMAPLTASSVLYLAERIRLAACVLTSPKCDSAMHERTLDGLLSGITNPLQMLDLLNLLNPTPAAQKRLQRLHQTVSLRCPECQSVLMLGTLEAHALEKHGLHLVMGDWLSPSDINGHCLKKYKKTKDDIWIIQAVACTRGDPKLMTGLAWDASFYGVKHPLLPSSPVSFWYSVGCLGGLALAILALLGGIGAFIWWLLS